MTTYTVNMATVGSVADDMATIATQIQTMLSELEASTAQHLAQWSSVARDAYNTAKAEWDAAAAQMQVQATNAHNALDQINTAYMGAEAQGSGMWNR